MKQIVTMCLIIIIIILFIGTCNAIETHYTKEATVVMVQGQEVTVADNQGHWWCFEGEDYTVGQRVEITLYTNHTDSIITDDIITEVEVQH